MQSCHGLGKDKLHQLILNGGTIVPLALTYRKKYLIAIVMDKNVSYIVGLQNQVYIYVGLNTPKSVQFLLKLIFDL